MASSLSASPVIAAPTLNRTLGVGALTLFGVAYMLPLAVFTTYGIATETTNGHLPGAYLVTTIAMLFTAYSYANMGRAYPAAGSAYTYTQRTFGTHFGFMTGWTLLLDYLVLPLLNFLMIGIYLNAAMPAVPVWVWVIGSMVIITALNVIGIRMVAGANLALIAIQVIFVVVFVGFGLRYVAGHGTTVSPLAPFFSQTAGIGTLMAGAAILALAFLGFDAVSTLSEEAKDPTRSIPKAIILTTIVGGLLFIVTAYVATLVFPDFANFTDADSAAKDVMLRAGGGALFTFFAAAYVAGSFASGITSQASVARILFAMGRDGQLPRSVFALIHPRLRTPYLSVIIVGVVGALGAILLPLDTVASVISFGALVAFSCVNASVILHYFVRGNERTGAGIAKYLVAPAIGLLLTVWLWTSLSETTFVAGFIWVAVGVVILGVVTRGFTRKPPVMEFKDADTAQID
jgi:amino acid transporter